MSIVKYNCITGYNPNNICGSAAFCGQHKICCVDCNEDCNIRCGWCEDKKDDKEEHKNEGLI